MCLTTGKPLHCEVHGKPSIKTKCGEFTEIKMACPIDSKEIEKLKMFVQFCSASPHILNRPELSFFKDFVEKLGGKVPASPQPQVPYRVND